MAEKTDSEAVVREIKRRTRKKYSSRRSKFSVGFLIEGVLTKRLVLDATHLASIPNSFATLPGVLLPCRRKRHG
jgi:hypothetical protein